MEQEGKDHHAGGDADKIATLDDPEVMNAMQEKYGKYGIR